MKISKILFILSLGICLLTLTYCKKDKVDLLDLPPEYSMDMDFSFTTKSKSAFVGIDTTNYQIARRVVLFWENRAKARTFVPVSAFKKAMSTEPTKTGEGNWIWSYSFATGGGSMVWNATLTATTEADSISWKMDIALSESLVPLSLTYFTGKSALDRTGGWWIINYPDQNDNHKVPFIKINWKWNNENEGWLKYTNCEPCDNNNGAYIEFGKNSSAFNRYFTIYIVNNPDNSNHNNKTYSIEWNSAGKNGRILVDSSPFGCWDGNYKDCCCE
jgi:hypothetical protein